MADQQRRIKSHQRLIVFITLSAFYSAVVICAWGNVYTFIFRGPRESVLSVSRSGVTLTINATVLVNRNSNTTPSNIEVMDPNSDDAGLFLRTSDQQFIPTFRFPGFHLISGGWGVSEQGHIAFTKANPNSVAVVVFHSLLLTITLILNILAFSAIHITSLWPFLSSEGGGFVP